MVQPHRAGARQNPNFKPSQCPILLRRQSPITPADLCLGTVAARANQVRPPAIKVYPGAVHSLDLCSLPTLSSSGHTIGGNPEAAADSFAMTQAFLAARLKVK